MNIVSNPLKLIFYFYLFYLYYEYTRQFSTETFLDQTFENLSGKFMHFISFFILGALAQLANNQEKGSEHADYVAHEKNQIFNLIMALYAGENEHEVFRDLDVLYQRHPREVEFYIP